MRASLICSISALYSLLSCQYIARALNLNHCGRKNLIFSETQTNFIFFIHFMLGKSVKVSLNSVISRIMISCLLSCGKSKQNHQVACIHLPNPSTMGRIWHKVNFYVEYNWVEFRFSFILVAIPVYYLSMAKRRDSCLSHEHKHEEKPK